MGAQASHPELPDIGAVVDGRYRLDRQLGEGGMGAVYVARDLKLNEDVALKAMLPALQNRGSWAQRFVREARAARAIQSEHVAQVLNVGEIDGGGPYMVLELLTGWELSTEIDRRAPLPIDEAVCYLLQACEGVAHAHGRNIVHRDLKPSNLFLAKSEGRTVVKVLDFGIAKADITVDPRTGGASLTETGHTLGTPEYMAPEQLRRPKDVDGRADIWALGLILHKMLTGRAAFEAESLLDHVVMIARDPPTPLRQRRSDAPAELEAVVQRCLQRDVSQRFPDVGALAAALAPFAGDSGPARARQVQDALKEAQEAKETLPLGAEPGSPIAQGTHPSSPSDAHAASTVREGVSPGGPGGPLAETVREGPARGSANEQITVPAAPFVAKTVGQAPAGHTAAGTPAQATLASVSSEPGAPTVSDAPPAPTVSDAPPAPGFSPATGTVPGAPALPRTISQGPPPPQAPPPRESASARPRSTSKWWWSWPFVVAVVALAMAIEGAVWFVGEYGMPGASKKSSPKPSAKAVATAARPQPSPVQPAVPEKPDIGAPEGMVLVAAGAFLMGHDDGGHEEYPQRSIYLDAFYIDRTEVTVADYRACVNQGTCSASGITGRLCNWGKSGRDDHPINCVNWYEADRYCRFAGKQLPTDAQWEKAGRGTDGREFPWGNAEQPCNSAGFSPVRQCGGYVKTTHPVGQKKAGASPYGVLDMGGSVGEWVADWYAVYYHANGPARNPTGPSSGTKRCVRDGTGTDEGRVWDREKMSPETRNYLTGFRCARPVESSGEGRGAASAPRPAVPLEVAPDF